MGRSEVNNRKEDEIIIEHQMWEYSNSMNVDVVSDDSYRFWKGVSKVLRSIIIIVVDVVYSLRCRVHGKAGRENEY